MLVKSSVVGVRRLPRGPGDHAADRRAGADRRDARGRSTTGSLGLLRTVAVAGLVMAAADYVFLRRKVGKQTRMTKHEVKQENKQTEGDPLLKGAIRSRQLAAARNRMMADVPTADVVLVNPTHVAVALTYDAERGAPRVVAKGAGAGRRAHPRAGRRARRPPRAGRPAGPRPPPLVQGRPGDPGRALRRRRAGPGLRDQPSVRGRARGRAPQPATRERAAVGPRRRRRRRQASSARGVAPRHRARTPQVSPRPADETRTPGRRRSRCHGRRDDDVPSKGIPPWRSKRLIQLGVPLGIVLIIVMLVVPLPAVVLDMLIALNITSALLVLLVGDVRAQAARLRRRSRPSCSSRRCSGWRSTSAPPGSCCSTATPARSSTPSATSSSAAR